MSSWKPILEAHQLPPEGTDESEHLDFKLQPWSRDERGKSEILRDVAQFANHLGGSLIVGAREDEAGRLQEYVDVEAPDVVVSRINDACYANLFPRVSLDCIAMNTSKGNHVVVANVQASVEPVAIRVGDKWEFYRRYGRSKKPIDFEEVQRMWTEGRRGKILMSKIPKTDLTRIHLDVRPGPGCFPQFMDADSGIILADDYFTVALASRETFNFPYEFVKAVWPRVAGGWFVALDVTFERYGDRWSARHGEARRAPRAT